MMKATPPSPRLTADRKALRRRVKRMYKSFNQGRWDDCYHLLDPTLRGESRLNAPEYCDRLRAFRAAYGAIIPWYIRISLHMDAATNKRDPRPFAYVYAVWQDETRRFHMFRERW